MTLVGEDGPLGGEIPRLASQILDYVTEHPDAEYQSALNDIRTHLAEWETAFGQARSDLSRGHIAKGYMDVLMTLATLYEDYGRFVELTQLSARLVKGGVAMHRGTDAQYTWMRI